MRVRVCVVLVQVCAGSLEPRAMSSGNPIPSACVYEYETYAHTHTHTLPTFHRVNFKRMRAQQLGTPNPTSARPHGHLAVSPAESGYEMQCGV